MWRACVSQPKIIIAMIHTLQNALYRLHKHVEEMGELVYSQLEKAKVSFLENDIDLAHEIVSIERHVDSMDLRTDEECEEILALFSPVATDLRFVLASLRINIFLERIGDHACSIAQYVLQMENPLPADLKSMLNIERAFELALSMLRIALDGYIKEDDSRIRHIFKADYQMNNIARSAPEVISEFLQRHCKSEFIKPALIMFSTLRKLERVGDLCKNIGEEVIFYLRAKVIKHRI